MMPMPQADFSGQLGTASLITVGTIGSNLDMVTNRCAIFRLLAGERALGEMSDHMLSGVKVKFGRDSYEYEMASGVRWSERKRPQRQAKPGAMVETTAA